MVLNFFIYVIPYHFTLGSFKKFLSLPPCNIMFFINYFEASVAYGYSNLFSSRHYSVQGVVCSAVGSEAG